MNKFVFLFLSLIAVSSMAQPTKGSTAGYSVLCVEENSLGFNWENKKWTKANFKPETYLITRVAPEKYATQAKALENSVLMCKPEEEDKALNINRNLFFTNGCYTFVKVGAKATSMNASMCSEVWQNDKLTHVHCHHHDGKFAFEVGGDFIRHPWHMDVRSTEQTKDSLVVSVGKCSPIN